MTSTLPIDEIRRHLDTAAAIKGDQRHWIKLDHGANGYTQGELGPYNIRLYSSPGRNDKHFVISGSACEHIKPDALQQLLRLDNTRATRIDLAADAETTMTPRCIDEMIKHSPERIRTWAKLQSPHARTFMCNNEGQTSYIGSPSSQRRTRFYNRRKYLRCEQQTRAERAEQIQEVIAKRHPSRLAETVIGIIRDFVDFIEPCANRTRSGLQGWWARIIESAPKLRTIVPTPPADLLRTLAWLRGAVSPSLALIMDYAGGDIEALTHLERIGRTRLNAKHQALLDAAGGFGAWNLPHRGSAPKTPPHRSGR